MVEKFELHTDVLVLGSGPSGFAAAYTAAKNGAKVILVEQSGDVGGISTSGLMSHWTGSCDSPLYYEILKRTAENNEGDYKNNVFFHRSLLVSIKRSSLD
jgi:flavin-dependent dehydrogenase